MAQNYYDVLGVGKSASKDEIRRAYRRLAQQHHPDKGGGEAEKFKEINEAYEVLSDDTKRGQYDQYGQTFEQARAQGQPGFGGFSGFNDFSDFMRGPGQNYSRGPFSNIEFDFGDIFSDIFGTPRQPRRRQGIDLEMTLTIDFLDSVFGAEKQLTLEKLDTCPVCNGSGAEVGSKIITCPKCHGSGQIIEHRRTVLGSFQQARVCDQCEGTGKMPERTCSNCHGRGVKRMNKQVDVVIPPGIDDDQRIKLTGEGEAGYRGSKPGDLYLLIKVRSHPEFSREGFDIRSDIPVSFYQAALGGKVEVNTVDGQVDLKIPPGTQTGKILRLKDKGVPYLESNKRGDHLVTVRVVTPTKLTRKEKELLQKLAEEGGESVQIEQSFWKRVKDNL
jgi:molecular chaperone DnaJ